MLDARQVNAAMSALIDGTFGCLDAAAETINEHTLAYLNRLSDLLFVWARYCNDAGNNDVLWVPGGER